MMWHEAAAATLPAGSVVQYWGVGQDEAAELARRAVAQGAQLVLSPGNHAYLDHEVRRRRRRSGSSGPAIVPVSASYDWEPAGLIEGIVEDSILGVESALWSETTARRAAVDYLAFPRLAGIAEIGWSPATALGWDRYRHRLAAHGAALGHRSASTTSAPPRCPGQRDRLVERSEAGPDEVAFGGVGRAAVEDTARSQPALKRAAPGGR